MSRVREMIEKENNPEVLKAWTLWMQEYSEELKKENARLGKIVAEREALKQQQIEFESKLSKLQNLIFKSGREKSKYAVERPRTDDQSELLVYAQSLVPPAEEKKSIEIPMLESHSYELDSKELAQASKDYLGEAGSAADWEELKGLEEKSYEVTVVERRYVKVEYVRKRYKLKQTIMDKKGEEKTVIITAPGVEKLLPGCTYSIEMATSVVCDKYLKHLPLERQRRDMQRLGLKVEVKTLYNLCWAVSGHMQEIVEKIKEEVLGCHLAVHADETRWKILNGKDGDGYLWSISNMAGAVYRFEPTRSGKVIEELLKDFEGVVISDGYGGYDRLAKVGKIKQAYCWSHVRRNFIDIEEKYPQEVEEILRLMGELFEVERRARNFEELKSFRNAESKLIIDKIQEWALQTRVKHMPKGELVAAINYMENLWPGLKLFLEDIRAPLTNNDAERTLRHAVLGRKNFNGSKTINGADTAATLYSVIESCKRVELDPQIYMTMVIKMKSRGEKIPTPLQYAKNIRQKN